VARYCQRCGKPRDASAHDDLWEGEDKRTRKLFRTIGFSRWGCRLRLIGETPARGDRTVPDSAFRVSKLNPAFPEQIVLNARSVHVSRLEPGGDLHD
jgi:hypothetical protein